MSSARPQASAPLPTRPPTSIHATAIISDKAQLTGTHPISIGANTVIHPFAKIDSTFGEVSIGEGCIVSERVVIGVASAGTETGVVVGDFVSIETGAVVETERLGRGSVVCVMGVLGRGCRIGEVSFDFITGVTCAVISLNLCMVLILLVLQGHGYCYCCCRRGGC